MDSILLSKYCVHLNKTIKDAIKILNDLAGKIVLVTNEKGVLVGTITDGDIRRGLLKGISIDGVVSLVMKKDFYFLKHDQQNKIKSAFKECAVKQIPILDAEGIIKDLLIKDSLSLKCSPKDNYVVIMAGGKGKRMGDITSDCPKPMLKISDKPVIEHIMDHLISFGFNKFIITVNYLKEKIIEYLGTGSDKNIDIKYLQEKEFLGTAGALSLLSIRNTSPIVVLNGDVLNKINYNDLLDYHSTNDNFCTICVRDHVLNIPFGVVNLKNSQVLNLTEKPNHIYPVNAGIYVFNPTVIDSLSVGTYCDMPELINTLIGKKMKVSGFPIHEYWLDIGKPETYIRAKTEWGIN